MKYIYITVILILSTANSLQGQCYDFLSGAYYHIEAKKTDGSFWIWGSNSIGQMGNNTTTDTNSPISIPTNNIVKVTNGSYNTFVIKNDGTLWGAGSNYYGCLGIGSSIDHSFTFVQIGTANNWKNLAPSESFTIAMKTDNSIWGWGQNDGYQMGNGTCCSDQLSPTLISSATDWKSIGTSNSRSAFAIKTNGTLWCWGSNLSALLGDNLTPDQHYPIQHNPDTDWDKMSVGYEHILVLKTNGSLWAWGGGQYGETGDGLPPLYNRSDPFQIVSAVPWKTMVAGVSFSLGIKIDGTLWAWGKNDVGQLGIGNTTNQPLPVQVGTDTNWDSVVAGYQYAAALKTDGSMWAWGDNTYGVFGNGTNTSSLVPVLIPVAGCSLANEQFDSSKAGLTITPNPATSQTTIQYSGFEDKTVVELYDLTARTMATFPITSGTGSVNIDTSSYPTGMYIIVVRNKENEILIQQKLSIH